MSSLPSEIQWALVEFCDTLDVYVTPIQNFKNFSPLFANDFRKDTKYDIKWDTSFDNSSGRHDGYFSGKVLLLGGKLLLPRVRLVCRRVASVITTNFVCFS